MKKKILYIVNDFPYPSNTDEQIQIVQNIKTLSKSYHVFLISFVEQAISKKQKQYLQKYTTYIKTFKKEKPLKSDWHFKNILSIVDINSQSSRKKRTITSLYKLIQPDFITTNTLSLLTYLPNERKSIQIYEASTLETITVYQQLMLDKKNILKKAHLLVDLVATYCTEFFALRKFDHIFSSSSYIKRILKNVFKITQVSEQKIHVTTKESAPVSKENTLLFIGDMTTHADSDALHWFIETSLPIILRENDQTILHVVGKIPDIVHQQLKKNIHIKVHGYQKHISHYFKKSSILILPYRMHSQQKNVALHAMSYGLPVVATRTGIQGIGAKENYSYILAYNYHDFALKCFTLLNSGVLRKKIGKQAKEFIQSTYNKKNHLLIREQYKHLQKKVLSKSFVCQEIDHDDISSNYFQR